MTRLSHLFALRSFGRRLLSLLGLALVVGTPWAEAQNMEYRVKAAFLFNFAKFAEWPDNREESAQDLTIAVWAPEDTFRAIAAALANKMVGRQAIVVTRFDRDAPPPQILFVHEESEPIPSELLRQLFAAHVLVVGESPDFAARYGIIGFVPRGDSLRFQINIATAEQAGIRLSGQLARLAEIVKSAP